jgi:hypothetical protein
MNPSETIIEAMKAELARQTQIHGVKFDAMGFTVHDSGHSSVSIHAYGECDINSSSDGAADCVAKKVGVPTKLAAEKRQKAARLMAEADALEVVA